MTSCSAINSAGRVEGAAPSQESGAPVYLYRSRRLTWEPNLTAAASSDRLIAKGKEGKCFFFFFCPRLCVLTGQIWDVNMQA